MIAVPSASPSGIGPAGTLENSVSSSACDIARRALDVVCHDDAPLESRRFA